ncbi:MAG: transcription termination/antitermination protein NusG [bacterium]|nr:transcription termination/antitermination protein NusG [bacterium]
MNEVRREDEDQQDATETSPVEEDAVVEDVPSGDSPAADDAPEELAAEDLFAADPDDPDTPDAADPAEAEAEAEEEAPVVEAEEPPDADALFLDLPDEAPAVDEADEVAAEPAAPEVPVSEEDELLAAVEIELSADEQAEIERRGRMRWFVIHANTGHENKVKRNIEMAIKSNHMEDAFGEILVATQEITEMKNGKRSTVKRKFFPSYILVEMIMDKETQHFINSIPGVTRFIGGTPLKPEPITREEVDRILGRISAPEETRETLEIPYLVGDSVQVMDGPFTEWVGVINEINHDKGKLKVMISIFGSETPVELDFLQVKSV